MPAVTVTSHGMVADAKEVLRIDQKWSSVKRGGHWVVPHRLELSVEWCDVTLDFTQAVITHDTLHLDVDMIGKTLTLIVGPGTVVDTDALTLEFSRVKNRTPAPGAPPTLHIEVTGEKRFGRITVRPPRRSLRRSP
ncbi:hypothetical protein [Kitasatospora sp. NPDC004531]